MKDEKMDIVILGLSITSSWGNGHATTYRGLITELDRLGHRVLFLEKELPWYASHRDMPDPDFCDVILYNSHEELRKYSDIVKKADLVIIGSYVPEGIKAGEWVQKTAEGVKAFYDIDTPVSLAKLENKDYEYLSPHLIPGYDLYLSFTGGPTLKKIEMVYGSPAARPLYCSVNPQIYKPKDVEIKWDLGYLGTYSDDRQPVLDNLMLLAAHRSPDKKFIVAGPEYPDAVEWPENVERKDHLAPAEHCSFYNAQRFTLNVTRRDMVKAGYSPSVRLFEAAACGVPIVSDYWKGLEDFFIPGKEILISENADDTLRYLNDISEEERKEIGRRGKEKILKNHTSSNRAKELVGYVQEVKEVRKKSFA